MRRITSTLLMSLGIASTLFTAVPSAADEFDDCARVASAVARLDCFDQQVAARRRAVAPAAEVAPVVTPPLIVSRSEAPAPSDLGLDARQLRKQHPELAAAKAAAASVESTVVNVTAIRPLIAAFELANGQVWEQVETASGLWVRPDDKVIVRQTKMGGFTLKSASGVVVRVRRIK
jgi:hypothetical protein